jgi:three-Cys-motif partner protein
VIILPLSDDDPKKWEYKIHTKVKHEILRKYLESWINVLGKWQQVCYFDCFAGRGIYADGSDGSPIIALKTISDLKQKRTHIQDVVCTFIEKDESNYNNLCQVIDAEISRNSDAYNSIIVKPPINDEFFNVASEITRKSNKLNPSFFFIDPFGFSGVPFQTIKDILLIPKTEVFINFMIRDVNRFLNSSNHQRSIEELFGVDDVMGIINSDYSNFDKETALLKLYRKQLHKNADVNFTYPFKVNADDKLQTTYYLIHATNNLLGCEIMKSIMYKAGTKGRFGYLGPAEGQMALANFSNLSEFKSYLLDMFVGHTLSFEDIRIKTVNETTYLRKDYQKALKELENESKVFIDGKGRKGAIKDESMVSFDPKIIEEKMTEEEKNGDNKKTKSQYTLDKF